MNAVLTAVWLGVCDLHIRHKVVHFSCRFKYRVFKVWFKDTGFLLYLKTMICHLCHYWPMHVSKWLSGLC